jgi:hypothetical protein
MTEAEIDQLADLAIEACRELGVTLQRGPVRHPLVSGPESLYIFWMGSSFDDPDYPGYRFTQFALAYGHLKPSHPPKDVRVRISPPPDEDEKRKFKERVQKAIRRIQEATGGPQPRS